MGSPKFGVSRPKRRAVKRVASHHHDPFQVDRVAVIAAARRIIAVANEIANAARRYDLVAEAAAIIKLCGGGHAD
jgi:hypothetical protein